MTRFFAMFWMACAVMALAAGAAVADGARVALLVGKADEASKKQLGELEQKLFEFNVTVFVANEADPKGLRRAIERFEDHLGKSTFALFYYGGSQVVSNGSKSYIKLENSEQIELGRILARMDDSKSRRNIALMEAFGDQRDIDGFGFGSDIKSLQAKRTMLTYAVAKRHKKPALLKELVEQLREDTSKKVRLASLGPDLADRVQDAYPRRVEPFVVGHKFENDELDRSAELVDLKEIVKLQQKIDARLTNNAGKIRACYKKLEDLGSSGRSDRDFVERRAPLLKFFEKQHSEKHGKKLLTSLEGPPTNFQLASLGWLLERLFTCPISQPQEVATPAPSKRKIRPKNRRRNHASVPRTDSKKNRGSKPKWRTNTKSANSKDKRKTAIKSNKGRKNRGGQKLARSKKVPVIDLPF